ncbi:MAG: hypothetical protein IKH06_01600 [Clostridiales bacterium]|nr:hypothetical protein [Clostridiales bacterium]
MKFCIISVIVRLLLAMAAGGLIGLALGAGFYEGAFIATALVLIAEGLFGLIGTRIPHSEVFKKEIRPRRIHGAHQEH